jgi:hypothetical protein
MSYYEQSPYYNSSSAPPTQMMGGGSQGPPMGMGMGMGGPPSMGGESRSATLWMGDLDPWMDENFVRQLWYTLGEQVTVKMIRDKFTG